MKLSKAMREVLVSLAEGKGLPWHKTATLTALCKRGLLWRAGYGDYLLTEAGRKAAKEGEYSG